MIEQIRERFNNGYYKTNKMSERDLYYIKHNAELKQLFLDFFYTSDEFNFDPLVFTHLGEEVLGEAFLSSERSYEYRKRFLYQYTKLLLQTYMWSFVDMDGLIQYFDLEDERENLEKYIIDSIIKNDGKTVIKLNNDNIEYILKNKRYDLFDYIEAYSYSNLTMENKSRLKEVYDNEHIELPSEIKKTLDLPPEDYTFEELLAKCKDKVLISGESSDKYVSYEKELIKRLKEIINNNDEQKIRDNIIDLVYIDNIIVKSELTVDEVHVLFKNGLITLPITDVLVKSDVIKVEDINDIFIDLVNKQDDPFDLVERIVDRYYGLNYILIDEKSNFIDKLIQEGYGLLLVNDPVNEKQIEAIKKNCIEGKNKIDSIPSLYNIEEMDFSLLKFVLDNYKVKAFEHAIHKFGFSRTNNVLEKYELVREYLKKNPDTKIDRLEFFDKEIFDSLLKREEYDVLAKSINEYISKNMTEDFLSWVKEHSDDSFLFHKIINEYSFFDNYREELFYPLLDNEIIMNELVDSIVHNDNLKDKFSDKFYDYIKYNLAKKYNLDVDKMDLLERQFGPNIIMYIKDNNIQKILNLDINKLKKLLSLFPKVDYTLTDIEAAYESINQYSFGRQPQNIEVINIFPNLLRVINDNNINLINKYKYKILAISDLDVINGIMKKNNFEGSPIEFLDFLLTHLEGKNVDILHEITNNVILQERKFYRNNHYFMKKNDYNIAILMQKCYDDDYLIEVIKSISSSDLYDIAQKFGIKEAKELIDLGKTENPDDILKYRAILINLVRKRINDLREKSPVGYSIFDELDLPYVLDEKKQKSAIERYYLYKMDARLAHDVLLLLSEKGFSYDKIMKLIDCFRNRDFSNLDNQEKEDIKLVTKIATELIREKRKNQEIGYEDSLLESFIIPELDRDNKIKRIFSTNQNKDLYPILMNLNLDLIDKNVFANDEIFDLLVDIMENKKIHMLDSSFYNKFADDKSNILDDEVSLVGFINFFKVIIEKTDIPIKEKDKILSHFSIVEILRQASTYSSMSSIYSSILGDEDARLVKRNPDPNSSKTKDANTRFNEAVEDTITCYKKQKITVPTFDKIISLSDNKAIEVVVGNFTSPCNITHGERTGACMRIGGVGEALYKYCINEENGFHVRFEDPKTHKYISRVSGFRNGNTVYLNQLRYSVDKDYTDEELIEASKIMAQSLIDMTKDSENPIENVFVTDGFAMNKADATKYKLNASEITKGISTIYTDYTYSLGCLLATTADKDYVPLDSKKVPAEYSVQRSKPKIIMDDMELAPNLINRVHTINQLLQGKTLKDDEIEVLEFKEDLLYCIANDDWYIYVDKNLKIKSEYISVDPRSKEEIDKYKTIVEEMLEKGLVKEKKHEQL